jgi:hypothetical protein
MSLVMISIAISIWNSPHRTFISSMSSDDFNREEAAIQAEKNKVKTWTSVTALRRPKEILTVNLLVPLAPCHS